MHETEGIGRQTLCPRLLFGALLFRIYSHGCSKGDSSAILHQIMFGNIQFSSWLFFLKFEKSEFRCAAAAKGEFE